MKKFNPDNKHKLNNPERLEWIPPKKLWGLLNYPNPSVIVDIGAGTGYITHKMAAFATKAKIHALDIEPLMVAEMENTLPKKTNILPALMKESVIDMPDSSVDIVWSTNVYHEFPNALNVLKEAYRALKPKGKVLIVDWEKKEESCKRGPEYDHRIDILEVETDLKNSGFSNIVSSTEFIFHYAVIGEKV